MLKFISKLKYRIDKFMQKGIYYQLALLFLIVIIVVIITSYIASLIFSYNYIEMLWKSSMHLLDTGTITAQEGEKGTVLLFLIIMTFAGIFIWSSVVAILNEGLRGKLNKLRNGAMFIQEEEHTAILGWNDAVVSLIDEYIKSDEVKTIVLLCNKPKKYIEQQISVLDKGHTEVIIREADPLDIESLRLLNIAHCKSVVVMSDSDVQTLKIILALKKVIKNTPVTVSAVIREKEFQEILESLSDNKLKIHSVYETEFLLKMVAQSTAFAGLAIVYNELFSYSGNEFYIIPNKHRQKTTIEIAKTYLKKRALLIGFIENGNIFLSPHAETVFPNKCELIILAQENPKANLKSEDVAMPTIPNNRVLNYNILVISNQANNELLKDEIAQYFEDASRVICLDYAILAEEKNKVKYFINYFKEHKINRILLLSPTGDDDAGVMMLLILIRHIIKKEKLDISILTGMNSVQNRNLITFDDVTDFIVSSRLIGMLLGQSSLNPILLKIFIDLLDTDGKELGMIPVASEHLGLTFGELYLKLLSKKSAVIGIERRGVFINPMLNEVILERDQLIIVADIA